MLRIKRLSLQGFKSFAQPSTFEPHHAITGIVGPNGSGKSNLVDALAFVIGESQQKAIRTPRIDDVIFAGSSELSRSNHSEVRLEVLDLDKGDEYFITRRLFSGGTSEYLINAKSVRLKELSSLLVEHNLEGESSFIISQGEVEKQLVSSSLELRKWFDNVLGLTNLIEKRRLTLNKIEKNNDNLSVIQNLIVEFESQIENLKIQAIAANRYRSLKNTEEVLLGKEIDLDIQHIKSSLSKIELDRIDFQHRINQITTEIVDKSNNISEQKNIISIKEKDFKFLQDEFYDLRVKFEQVKSNINHLNYQKKSIEDDIKTLELKVANINGSIDKYSQHLKINEEKKLKFADQLNIEEQTLKEIQKEFADHLLSKQQVEKEAFELKLKKDSLEKEYNSIQTTYKTREKYLQSLKDRQDQLTAEKNIIEQKIENQKLDKLQIEIQKLEHELEELKLTNEALSSKILELQQKSEVLNVENRKISVNHSKLIGELKGLEAQSDVEQNQLVINFLKSQGIRTQVLKDLLEYEEQHIPVLELCLGNLLSAFVITRAEFSELLSNKDLINLPPTDIFIIEQDPLKQVTSQLGIITGPQEIIQLLPEIHDTTFSSKYYEVSKNIVRIGTGKTLIQDSLKRNKRIKTLRSLISEDEIQLKSSQLSIDELSKELQIHIDQKNSLQKSINNKLKAYTELSQNQKKMVLENRLTIEKNNEIRVLLPEIKSNIEAEVLSVNQLKESMKSIFVELEEVTKKYSNIQIRVSEVSVIYNQKNSVIRNKTELLAKLDQELNKVNLQIKENQTNLVNNSALLAEIQVELNKSTNQLASVIDSINNFQQNKPLVSEIDLQKFKDKLFEHESQIKEFRKEHEQLNSELRRLELEKVQQESRKYRFDEETESLTNQLAVLEQRIQKELSERSYDAIEYQLPNFDFPEVRWITESTDLSKTSKRKIREILTRINSAVEYIGNVNLLAEPQLKEIEQKLTSYQDQIDDIKTAQDNLLQSELELKTEAINRFKTRLKETEQNFYTIFKTLFGSGSSVIKLQDPEDVLYSPIDVQIQLPGKKTTNLNLLSGGERSLLFIALFFAANAVSSCGFLILDEVDAALDDANIIKFKRLIKEWSKQMQIVIVTHNRTTMEIADKLIGVVNQPKGVSIVVPVELQEAAKKFHYN